jgi:hypothetical protein
MIRKTFLNHLRRQFTRDYARKAPCPKMPFPNADELKATAKNLVFSP